MNSDADGIVDLMYTSMSFEPGEQPAWERQAEVFAPDARLVRVNDDGVFEFDPRTFRENLEAMGMVSFWEGEVWRETQVFGDVAHVLSAYEMRTRRGGDLIARAIKSIQLFRRDGRWWISAMIWRREGKGFTLAARPPS